jgi:hypothetical protein
MAKIRKANDWYWAKSLPVRMWLACVPVGLVIAIF